MQTRMCPDDMAWEQAEETSDNWLVQCLDVDILRPIADFVLVYSRGVATEFAILRKGSYNVLLRLKYRTGATVIRLSQPGAVFFPEEKVVNEVAVMRFLADQTSIPVPFIIHSGTKKESSLQLSPFIIMDYIEHETKMYNALNTPGCPTEERGTLDPNISEDKLEMLYRQLADILLRLSAPSLPQIGSLSQVDDFTWKVARRPLSINMNELVRLGGLPRSKLPDLHTTFNTASSYLEALADLNLEHLIYQRNDAVESADDCRRKFVARKLFRKLAKDKRLTNPSLEKGPFKIWCDDLRPANMLLDEKMQIFGVVDWEFTYAAPGIEDWTGVCDNRLKTFLKVMKDSEDIAIQQGRLTEDQRLSGPMGLSWENGDFWIMYAVLHSFAFDTICWQKIDPRFFGPTESPEEAWKERIDLLDEEEKDEMERLVARKLKEMNSRVLAWDPDESGITARSVKQSGPETMARGPKRRKYQGQTPGHVTISDKPATTGLSR
ncbi:Aminoglycoside phosphotransferase domain-containing protein [Penicillium ucsense]|uniref:Aminoglycoside phosphotransferase domain-containing protein n=1 Tax=Penicillium ucsense TaxID=2839758 RepID=A0A8J8WA37_9EURO|nr:Aminoglycoside phosphotransferase domain-containing protein [Penicillium ucsense]KAF7737542.1 Aminoglycoside phosphotransferase domain-containing protein [Penicillium ucsense]